MLHLCNTKLTIFFVNFFFSIFISFCFIPFYAHSQYFRKKMNGCVLQVLLYSDNFGNLCLQSVLLEDHVRELRRVIRPGAKRLNWNSLGIKDYCHKCEQVSLEQMIAIKGYLV